MNEYEEMSLYKKMKQYKTKSQFICEILKDDYFVRLDDDNKIGLLFPFKLTNESKEAIIINKFKIEFYDCKDQEFWEYRGRLDGYQKIHPEYYLSSGQSFITATVFEFDDIRKIKHGIYAVLSFVDYTNTELVLFKYYFENDEWKLLDKCHAPVYPVYIPDDLFGTLRRSIEVKRCAEDSEKIEFSAFSVSMDRSFSLSNWKTVINGQIDTSLMNKIVKLKTVLYDENDRIIDQYHTDVETLNGFNTFQIGLRYKSEAYMARVKKIYIIVEKIENGKSEVLDSAQ